MLTPYSQSKFVQKILTSQSGERFRVLFYVTLVNGELKGKIISAQAVNESASQSFKYSQPVVTIAAPRIKKKVNTEYVSAYAPTSSPYFSLEFLINSQPTRAPAFA
jgi:hypothetical protein